MKHTTKKLVVAALLAALTCVATMIIKVPSPLKGYVNLGDCVVLLAGFMLPPTYGFAAAAIGSALADLFLGYVTYAPATLIIKGGMALIAFLLFTLLRKRSGTVISAVISGLAAEVFMILGYFLFEGILYGFVPSAVNIPANAIQGAAGVILGVALIKLFEKKRLT